MSDIAVSGNVPFWAVSESVYCDENYCLTIRCNGKRFYIIAEADDLHGDAKEEFVEMVKDEDYELEAWVAEPLLPFIKELASAEPDSLTLAEFYNPETFIFKLLSNDKKLYCVCLPDDTDPEAYNSPNMSLFKLPTDQRIESLDASTATGIRRAEEDFGGPPKFMSMGNSIISNPFKNRAHSFVNPAFFLN